ncbi:5-hydroxyisourate hydrolase-like protein (transthyretin family) [Deinobacterium chartae]|uniref:5-hydroxyisourate hydrolase-like protein (Transthyretin family) n=1 Tax=Deinobacterium chartae TaxID=521158 RepID=A0A841I403_9DEIO|nr:carboxypeptidase-like regulatory domain-containing protein [Deinobacterium chartae]MBB6098732.1 5-hydroxyisourate hydrolase-like protein (transthyretin family) [Deinobacterium chartae]
MLFRTLALSVALSMLMAACGGSSPSKPGDDPDPQPQPNRYGALSGTVADTAAGRPVEGTTIHAYNDQGRQVAQVNSDAEGRYTFAELPTGLYRLSLEKSGFAGSEVIGVNVYENQTTSLDIIQKTAFDPGATTTPPRLEVTLGEGELPSFTNSVTFRVRVADGAEYARPLRAIYAGVGRTPGDRLFAETRTSGNYVLQGGDDTGVQELSGAQLLGFGSAAGEQLSFETVAYDFNNNRVHLLRPMILKNTASSQQNNVIAPVDVKATAITLSQGRSLDAVQTLGLGGRELGRSLNRPAPLDAPHVYIQVSWCYLGTKANQLPFAFDVERSLDGQSYQKVGSVGGAASSSCANSDQRLTYVDNAASLRPGQRYHYRVIARGANRQTSTNSSTTMPLPVFNASPVSPADESMNVSPTPDFVVHHPQRAIGADGAFYVFSVLDNVTAASYAWRPLPDIFDQHWLYVEEGTGNSGNRVPEGKTWIYDSARRTYLDDGLVTGRNPAVLGYDVDRSEVRIPYNFDGSATLAELQSYRTYTWQLDYSVAYKYNAAEGYRIEAYSVDTVPVRDLFGKSQLATENFDFTVGAPEN